MGGWYKPTFLQNISVARSHQPVLNLFLSSSARYLSSSYDMRILPAKRGGRDSPNYRWEGVLKRSWLEKMCLGGDSHENPDPYVVVY